MGIVTVQRGDDYVIASDCDPAEAIATGRCKSA